MLIVISGCSDEGPPASNTPTPIANAAPAVAKQAPNGPKSPTASVSIPQGSGFDFYVLALSWSPAHCASKGSSADPEQCNAPMPFRFIVHGLWPQYERGYPESCATGGYPSREQVRSVLDLTPSAGLLRYEWEKHGTCSGLPPADYFAVMRAASDKVIIPAQFSGDSRFALGPQAVESAFARANPGLSTRAMATVCYSGLLTEVRICLDKSLQFRDCPEIDRNSCRANSVTIVPAR